MKVKRKSKYLPSTGSLFRRWYQSCLSQVEARSLEHTWGATEKMSLGQLLGWMFCRCLQCPLVKFHLALMFLYFSVWSVCCWKWKITFPTIIILTYISPFDYLSINSYKFKCLILNIRNFVLRISWTLQTPSPLSWQ